MATAEGILSRTLPHPCAHEERLLGDTLTFWGKGDTFCGSPGPVPVGGGSGCEQCPCSGV